MILFSAGEFRIEIVICVSIFRFVSGFLGVVEVGGVDRCHVAAPRIYYRSYRRLFGLLGGDVVASLGVGDVADIDDDAGRRILREKCPGR